MDYEALRARCMSFENETFPASPDHHLVGVVWHHITRLSEIVSTAGVLWVKAKSSTTISQVKAKYQELQPPDGRPMPTHVGLSLQNQHLSDDVSIGQLNFFHDRIIILQAHNLANYDQDRQDSEEDEDFPIIDNVSNEVDEVEFRAAYESDSESEDNQETGHISTRPHPRFITSVKELDKLQKGARTQFDSSYQKIIDKITELERIEAIAKQGLKDMSAVEDCLRSSLASPDAPFFLGQIKDLRAQARYARTVIGVVGVTGAGKSSVLNAVLGEENILPTSGMRACTAVPVELAWNDLDDPSKKYRAVIEFIDGDDWRKELKLCLDAMADKPSEVTAESDSEAGMAYAKIRAVYPNITKPMLAKTSVKTLFNKPHVQHHLGLTRGVTSPSAERFFAGLQKFIDTVEDSATRRGPKQPELWPLVKCVKIYLKADALSTGTVLVDLPGAQDSNAARAAIADQYMQQCNGLWIVAPINRAVNDKTAKALLGEHFKRQMKFDCIVENVTFICSKSDDISVGETQKSLDLHDQLTEASHEWKGHKATEAALGGELAAVGVRIKELEDSLKATRSEIRTWNNLKKQQKQGRKVWAPEPTIPKKRPSAAGSAQAGPGKKLKQDEPTVATTSSRPVINPFTLVDDDEESDDDDISDVPPLTEDDISAKIQALKATEAVAVRDGNKEYEARNVLDTKLEATQELINSSADKQRAICIAARNDWSRNRIRQEYALEIKELDEECAEMAGGDRYVPAQKSRNFESAGESLPVFCVSSRAYQALCGRHQSDGRTKGFLTLEQTEVPQLVSHCKKMTELSRITTNRNFLRDFTNFLMSLDLWLSRPDTGGNLSAAKREKERKLLAQDLKVLKDNLGRPIDITEKDIRLALEKHIDKSLQKAQRQAEVKAGSVADGWGGTEDGLHWATYRAVVKRDGAFTNRKGDSYDFNKDLSALFEKYLASGWEKCFQHIIPKHLQSLGQGQGAALNKLHELVADRAKAHGFGVARIQVLGQKLRIWKERCIMQGDELNKTVSTLQKGISRDIVPVIRTMMRPAYQAAAQLRGRKSPEKMMAQMEAAVRVNAKPMFSRCSRRLRKQLKDLQKSVSKDMENFLKGIFKEIEKDYNNALFGVEPNGGKTSEEEQEMRRNLVELIRKINVVFIGLVSADTVEAVNDIEIIEDKMFNTKDQVVPDEQDAAIVAAEVWIQEESGEDGENPEKTDEKSSLATPTSLNETVLARTADATMGELGDTQIDVAASTGSDSSSV